MNRSFKILICIALALFLSSNTMHAQVLRDTTCLRLIKMEVDCIYRMQFANAREIGSKIRKLYPEHPVVLLLNGLLTYWSNYPLMYNTTARISFEQDLHQCMRLAGKDIPPKYEAEYLLTNLCARGMLLKFYDDNDLTLTVIPLAAASYKYLRHSFGLVDDCVDLNYYTGAYNYLREAYPRIYPVYKPLALIFPPGSMEKGLKELNAAASKAVVLRAESYILLALIYSNFENNYRQALYYCKTLLELYPTNVLYLAVYIKNLLLMKYYDQAEKLIITSLRDQRNKYFLAQLDILKGILLEKKYHNPDLARQYYRVGIKRIAIYNPYGNEYCAYAYFGLSRICEFKNEKDSCRFFRDKANKLSSYKKVNFDN